MSIFITGAKGFIGQNLILQCKEKGIDYIATDVFENSDSNYFQADINSKEIESIIPNQCEAIIHLAGLSRDSDCKNNGYECFSTNVMGTLNLIEAAKVKKVKQFIFASSEWVYDNFENYHAKDEKSIINISNLNSEYALSKIVSESNLRQQFQHHFCSVTILRFGIIYGPRDMNWSAVESLFYDVKTKEEVTVGSLKTGRCFIHVSDIGSGIIQSIGLDGFNTINLQGDKFITLANIIDTSKEILDRNPKVTERNPENFSVRLVSNEKAKRLLKWKPEIDLKNGLKTLNNITKD